MKGKEQGISAPNKNVTDKGLDAWQKWNKFTLGIEGAAAVGAIVFGVPWLLALAATGAAVDGVQIVTIDELQKRRKAKEMRPGRQYSLKAA